MVGSKVLSYLGTSTTMAPFPLDLLLPNDKENLYRFEGSLTTPGCFETVTWTVLQDTVKISQSQVRISLPVSEILLIFLDLC